MDHDGVKLLDEVLVLRRCAYVGYFLPRKVQHRLPVARVGRLREGGHEPVVVAGEVLLYGLWPGGGGEDLGGEDPVHQAEERVDGGGREGPELDQGANVGGVHSLIFRADEVAYFLCVFCDCWVGGLCGEGVE